MAQVVDVIDLSDHPELQWLAIGGAGEAVADLEVRVVKQTCRCEDLARR